MIDVKEEASRISAELVEWVRKGDRLPVVAGFAVGVFLGVLLRR